MRSSNHVSPEENHEGSFHTIGPDGNLYVSSSANNRVLRYDGHTGKFLDIFIESDSLQRPFSLIFGPDSNLYVSSGMGAKVLRFDGRNGRFLNIAAAGEGLKQPIGLAFGPDKKLYAPRPEQH